MSRPTSVLEARANPIKKVLGGVDNAEGKYRVETCRICLLHIRIGEGSRRTICPHCGNFLSEADEAKFNLRARPQFSSPQNTPSSSSGAVVPQGSQLCLPRIEQRRSSATEYESSQNEEKKNSGPIKSIKSFFKNLRNKSNVGEDRTRMKNSNSTTTLNKNVKLPPIARNTTNTDNDETKKDESEGEDQEDEEEDTFYEKQWTVDSLKQMLYDCEDSKEFQSLETFLCDTFGAYKHLLHVVEPFQGDGDPSKGAYNPEHMKDPIKLLNVDSRKVETIFEILLESPKQVQSAVWKAIIDCLIADAPKDESGQEVHQQSSSSVSVTVMRGIFVHLQNPLFRDSSTYGILSHFLRRTSTLNPAAQQYIVTWFREVVNERDLELVVQRLNDFISWKIFAKKSEEQQAQLSKHTWWVPACTKVLALLNAANNIGPCRYRIKPEKFYNRWLEKLNLERQYTIWIQPPPVPPVTNSKKQKQQKQQTPQPDPEILTFSFCQYPFILSLKAKREILYNENESSMMDRAKRALISQAILLRTNEVNPDTFFLTINVRRDHLIEDSLLEITEKRDDLRKKLKVTFHGEPGMDVGGLTKEWFMLLIQHIFRPEYGMFTWDKTAGTFWFRAGALHDTMQEFHLIGVLMGLAVYNSINLDLKFPHILYRKILSPTVCPFNDMRAPVGIIEGLGLEDLKDVSPTVYSSLKQLLDHQGDVKDDFCLNFQISVDELGEPKSYSLKKDGADIEVTNENRTEYVKLYVEFLLNKVVYHQFRSFYFGFHSVCASNALLLFRPEEIDLMVCGSPTFNIGTLRESTKYENGYDKRSPTILAFWDELLSWKIEDQKRFLHFVTGCDRVPAGGETELEFSIAKVDRIDILPFAFTCFNKLALPDYKTREKLTGPLTLAVQNAEGFGIE